MVGGGEDVGVSGVGEGKVDGDLLVWYQFVGDHHARLLWLACISCGFPPRLLLTVHTHGH